MKVVNLFAGEGTWARAWTDRGHDVWRTDITDFPGTDHVSDILELRLSDIPRERDVLLASPDCTAFSVMSISTHWRIIDGVHVPLTPKAHNRMGLVFKTLAIAEALVERDGLWAGAIENPRGKLRKLGMLDRYDHAEVMYCHYGDTRMKPTDLWGAPAFPTSWKPKDICHSAKADHPDDCCCRDHDPAPRGAKEGTQGLSTQARSHMPYELSWSFATAAEDQGGFGEHPAYWQVSPAGFVFYRSFVRADRQHFLTPYDVKTIPANGTPYIFTGRGTEAAGFLLKNDREIANIFSTFSAESRERTGIAHGERMLEAAIQLGGNRVEYFEDPRLDDLYGRHGFKETDRFPFDLALLREDFPEYDPDVGGTPAYVIARLP